MNKEDVLNAALGRLMHEKAQLKEVLRHVDAAIDALKGAIGLPAGGPKQAPHGALEAAILDVLHAKTAMSNSEIRGAILATGYPYSLKPLHVTKTLIRLHQANKISREGKDRTATYMKKKDASQVALSVVERVTGGKLKG